MKLGQYIVVGGIVYFAFFMLRKPRQGVPVTYDSNGEPIYSDLIEIDRGNGIVEYRSEDGKLSTVNVGTYNPNPQASQRPAIDRPTNPLPSVDLGLNSYTSINGDSNGRSVTF